VLFGSSRSSNRSSSGNNTEFGIAQDFLDILVRPARRKLASAEFEGTKLRVAHAVLDHAADTEVAYSTLQGSMHATAMLQAITDAAEAAYEFARRQQEAGNITRLDLLAHQGLYEQARIDLTRSEATVLEDRERLTSLMGLWGTDTQWRIPERLPDLPTVEVDLAHLESLAISRRLDLAAERWRIASIAKALSITLHWRYVPLINVGVDTERDTDGERVTGPSLAIELPIFDHGQAKVARVEALLREGQQRMTALAIEIRSDVRAARNKLVFSRELVEHYRGVVIPVRERSVAESQRYYNYMLVGVYQLLQAKRDELDAYGDYIGSLRDYWVARAELKRAVGGSFTPDAPDSSAPPMREPRSQDDDASHHDH
ncbi:MAG: TolC family protein, partial [Gemmatimonadota bacterium]|nr:TolC family protein [Gemmatimonadota bacterium]